MTQQKSHKDTNPPPKAFKGIENKGMVFGATTSTRGGGHTTGGPVIETMGNLDVEKALNLRFTDFNRKDDLPTKRDLEEPIKTGNLAGWKMDKAKYNKMLDEYYDFTAKVGIQQFQAVPGSRLRGSDGF